MSLTDVIPKDKDKNLWSGITSEPKTFEEEIKEERRIQNVVDYLESHGIQVKTEYGNFRPTYMVLKDISEHWAKFKK